MYISAQPKATEVLGFTCTCFLVTELPSRGPEPGLPSDRSKPPPKPGEIFRGLWHLPPAELPTPRTQSCPSAWMPKDLFLGCRGPISMTWSKIDGEPCLSAGCGYSYWRSTPISRLQRCPHPNISFRIPGGPTPDKTAHHKGGWAIPFYGVPQHSSPGLGLAPISGLVGNSYLC